MSRIDATFARLREQGRKALIPFVTAGFPQPDITPELMWGMAEAGADVIELGVPFSDPSADGPVIQKAGDRALAAGIGLREVLAMVSTFRQRDTSTPVVLMGYANPIERMGEAAFAKAAAAAGVDGVLVVDYPPEECESFAGLMRDNGMDPIFLLAPTSTDARIAAVARVASGYLYYVSLKGVTGSATLDLDSVAARLPLIKRHANLPVGVGFGIRDAETACAIGSVADAVVIGSRLVQLLEDAPRDQAVEALRTFIAGIRQALDA